MVSHEGNLVDDGADGKCKPSVTFGVAAAVTRCSTTGPPMREGATAGTSATPEDAVPEGG